MSNLELVWALFSIIMLDIVLGGDNAVIIAMASKRLDPHLRKKAIFYGTFGAVAVRGTLAIVAVKMLELPYLHVVGGILLVAIAFKLLVEHKDKGMKVKEGGSLGEAIRIIITADVIMGLDNVLAIAGASNGHWGLIILGLLVSVPIILWGSFLILKLMDRFPIIIYIGGAILAWTAGKMIVAEMKLASFFAMIPYARYSVPLLFVIVILSISTSINRKHHQAA
ncbi:TerC family protein [Rubeoparvulum massiliense]|uniref:TerC family protein n=1 Tax=Rubeoparvulum massiliense TaxID=1631346 RepID=UPI000B27153D|nr:TerC family protein [Rubeoparvulum massiliense]